MQLDLTTQEATYLDDVLGMWLEGLEGELEAVKVPDADAHWSTLSTRRQFQQVQRLRLRLQLEMSDG